MSQHDIQPGLEWKVDLMRPEDAEGVARLFRSVYGEGYPVRVYMEPEKLIAENQAKRVISSVLRTTAGDIVGHNALYHSAPSRGIFESGAGLVHKLYRGGKGGFGELYAHGIEIAREMGKDAVWGEPVTNTVFAQKMTLSHGMIPFAVEADLMPAAAYTTEASAPGRVSTFQAFDIFNRNKQTVYLPGVYQTQLKAMYGDLLELRETPPASNMPPAGEKTVINPEFFKFADLVRMATEHIGPDFAEALEQTQNRHMEMGARILQLWLNLTDPHVGWAVDQARARGYFLGGPLPFWFGGDGLLVQKTLAPPHWDDMQIAFDRNRELAELVKRDWLEVTQ